jgi:hypothetical protein
VKRVEVAALAIEVGANDKLCSGVPKGQAAKLESAANRCDLCRVRMVDAVAWLEARHDVVKRAIGKVEPFFERHAVERSKRKAPNTGGRVFGAVGTWVRSVLQWTAVHTRAQYVKRSGCGACAGVAPTRGIPQVVSRRRGLDIPSDGREDFIGRDLRWARAPARLDLEPAADAARDIVFAVGPMVRCSSAA